MIDINKADTWTRRRFLHTSVMASAALTVPMFLERSAFAAMPRSSAVSSRAGVPEDRVLVVIQLGGGNDGLNTVVPFRDDNYYRARPGIGIPSNRVIPLQRGVDVGLHPALTGLKGLYDDGLLSIVQGVGYPNPNRSHFKSMDIWHTADTSGRGSGWLGRYIDNACHGSPADDARAGTPNTGCSGHTAVALGREAPLALHGDASQPVAFESQEQFTWTGKDLHESLNAPYDKLMGAGGGDEAFDSTPRDAANEDSNVEFLTRTAMDARVASEEISKAVAAGPTIDYPRTDLGRQLAMVSAMIRAGLRTRVYYVSMGGFDTHAGQGGLRGQHANLLQQFGDALRTFWRDLANHGNDTRVLAMTFSEFGRRVGQNASNGTDHGTAAPVFLSGPNVRAGVRNAHPSLTDLTQGDLKYTVDFRSVYAALLDKWLKADSREVLGERFRPASILRT